MRVTLGAIADDFTGATDLASTWAKEGVRVTQVIGVPGAGTDVGDAEAVVVALKSRTAPVGEAVGEALKALDWLRRSKARQVVFKYCSTFDSTASGNIGPVADALCDALGADVAIVCPAFPANGRTVYKGHLFVGDLPLHESPMKDHPLTPMRDSSLVRLMEAQSAHGAGLVPLEDVREGAERIRARMESVRSSGRRYCVTDATSDDDLRAIGEAASDHPLVTGGSGVGMGLPAKLREAGHLSEATAADAPSVEGREIVLAGSCSAATREQIDAVKDGWPTRRLDPMGLADGDREVASALDWAKGQPPELPALIYASAGPEEVSGIQERLGTERAGKAVEEAMGQIASELGSSGFTRMIVAGGETSGAVVSALGVRALRIGPEIAPGVPWTETTGGRRMALALKSGNFGSRDFFREGFRMLA